MYVFLCLGMPVVSSLSSQWLTHTIQCTTRLSSIWLVESVKWHTSPRAPALCCVDWFSSSSQSVSLITYSPHSPELHPFYAVKLSQPDFFYTTHPAQFSFSTSVYLQGAHGSLGLLSSTTDGVVCLVPLTDQSNMGSSMSCVPQHNFRLSKSFIRRNR